MPGSASTCLLFHKQRNYEDAIFDMWFLSMRKIPGFLLVIPDAATEAAAVAVLADGGWPAARNAGSVGSWWVLPDGRAAVPRDADYCRLALPGASSPARMVFLSEGARWRSCGRSPGSARLAPRVRLRCYANLACALLRGEFMHSARYLHALRNPKCPYVSSRSTCVVRLGSARPCAHSIMS